jgi:hypothetical protein
MRGSTGCGLTTRRRLVVASTLLLLMVVVLFGRFAFVAFSIVFSFDNLVIYTDGRLPSSGARIPLRPDHEASIDTL